MVKTAIIGVLMETLFNSLDVLDDVDNTFEGHGDTQKYTNEKMNYLKKKRNRNEATK